MCVLGYMANHHDGSVQAKVLWFCSSTHLAILVCFITITQVTAQVVLLPNASLPQYNPLNLTCARERFRTTIINNVLCLEGGAWTPDPPKGGLDSEHLWTIDLSGSFNAANPPWQTHVRVDTTTSQLVYGGCDPILWNNGNGSYFVTRGWLFLSHYPGVHLGEPYVSNNVSYFQTHLLPARIFQYDGNSNEWTSELLGSGGLPVIQAAFTTSKSLNLGFALGGLVYNFPGTTLTALSNPTLGKGIDRMVIYDLNTGQWKSEVPPPELVPSALGKLHALESVGNKGVLVHLSARPYWVEIAGDIYTVYVYDIDSGQWYQQNTTGDHPRARVNACSVMAPSPDSSSFQIYLFGGTTGAYLALDLYVLSVPLFRWIKIPLDGYPDQYGLASPDCTLYEDRQMLIIPGVKHAGWLSDPMVCEKNNPIAIFDTYEWKFRSTFDPNLNQNLVPAPIVNLTGGTSTEGKATVTGPINGWDDPGLGAIFKVRNTVAVASPTKSSTPTTKNPTSATNKQHKMSEAIRAIGGAIGGVLFLCVTAFLLFLYKKREPNGKALDHITQNPSKPQGHDTLQEEKPPPSGENPESHVDTSPPNTNESFRQELTV